VACGLWLAGNKAISQEQNTAKKVTMPPHIVEISRFQIFLGAIRQGVVRIIADPNMDFSIVHKLDFIQPGEQGYNSHDQEFEIYNPKGGSIIPETEPLPACAGRFGGYGL
jgi:hypothetical protein